MLWRSALITGSTIEKDDPWQLLLIFGLVWESLMFSRTASKDLDGASFWLVVVFWHVEEVLGDLQLSCGERELRPARSRRVGVWWSVGGTVPVTR